jgi:hypothetical protein
MSGLWAQIAAIVALVAGGLGALWAYGRQREVQGKTKANTAAQEKDRGNARRIEDAADAARAAPGGDPVERLRRHGRLRDD